MSVVVIVTGGRKYANRPAVYKALDYMESEFGRVLVVHGGATGADSLAGAWARERGRAALVVHADWKGDGRAAGPKRNEDMVQLGQTLARTFDCPVLGVAFPGGRGTADCVRRMGHEGVDVIEVAG